MGKVRRRSKIETDLPAELRDAVNRLLLEGATYEDAAAYCQSRGHDISKSSMGRYGKRFFEAYQAVKQFEDQSRALVSQTGESLSMDEAIAKMLQQRVMAAVMKQEFDITEIPRLLSDVARLQASNVLRERIKADIIAKAKKEAFKQAAAAVEAEEKRSGPMTAERFREIIREQYGV